MGRRRPPRATVRAAVREALADLEPGDRIVVALSGGADSLALTAGVGAVSRELGLLCEAVVVDHQLQPGSAAVAARAAEQAGILGCADARVLTVDVPGGPGAGGVEAAARAARYAALEAASAGSGGPAPVPVAAAVLLGHTREDQAETVLLGLARGSGTRSLAGMRGRSGRYRRPLLDLPRDVVAAAAWAAAESDPRLEPWIDPHNGDPAYARVRVRGQVLPLLESTLGPGIVDALARSAAMAQEDADALDEWADRVWAQVQAGGDGDGSRADGPGTEGSPPRPEHGAPARPESSGPPASSGALLSSGPPVSSGALLSSGPPVSSPVSAGPAPGGPGSAPPEGASPQSGGLSPLEGQQPAGFPAVLAGGALAGGTLPPRTLPVGGLRSDALDLPAAIVHRVIRRFLVDAGCPPGDLSFAHIRAVAGLLEPTGARSEIALPGGVRARRVADALVVRA